MLSKDQIILERYKGTTHILTPTVVKSREIRNGFIAAEVSWGDGMFGDLYMVGVSVAVYDPDRGGPDLAPRLSTSFSGESLTELLAQADDYVNGLVTSLRWCSKCGWGVAAAAAISYCPACGGPVTVSRPRYD